MTRLVKVRVAVVDYMLGNINLEETFAQSSPRSPDTMPAVVVLISLGRRLTARHEVGTKLRGAEFLLWPVSTADVQAALLRAQKQKAMGKRQASSLLSLDRRRRLVRGESGVAALSPLEYHTLEYLMSRRRQSVALDDSSRHVFGLLPSDPSSKVVRDVIRRLGTKLKAVSGGQDVLQRRGRKALTMSG